MAEDTYKTILRPTENVLYKDRGSKFFGYAFPVTEEVNVKTFLEQLKKEHHNARHWCYAYRIGIENMIYRANDDGEPNNSAGMPIYGQIQSFELKNILVVVVRYFGGIKLGVGGLITAYKTTAQLTLEKCKIVTKTINHTFLLTFDYKDMNKVMRVIKEKKLDVINQELMVNCKLTISVRKKEAANIFMLFDNSFGITIKAL